MKVVNTHALGGSENTHRNYNEDYNLKLPVQVYVFQYLQGLVSVSILLCTASYANGDESVLAASRGAGWRRVTHDVDMGGLT